VVRPNIIPDALLGEVKDLVASKRGATMQQLCDEFAKRTGVAVCTITMHRAIKRAGLQRVKTRQARAPSQPRRYGYTQAHRSAPSASQQYASSLTDAEWALAADLFESPEGSRGRPAKYERRTMVDACCYVLRTGCAWTMLPKSFPPWLTVHKSFSRWAAQGKFEQLQQRLLAQWRQRIERNAAPSAVVIDSQANRISPQGGASGYDAGKKVKGRKRHIVTDTLGLLLAVSVTAASVQDRDGAPQVVAQACAKYSSIKLLYADCAYAGKCAERLQHEHHITVEVVRRPGAFGEWDNPQQSLFTRAQAGGFVILPKRWVVERTHAWLERERRMVMHHDRSAQNATAWAWLAQSRMLLRRLAIHG
jgi:putative transposase